MEENQHYGKFAHLPEISGACLRVMVLDDPKSGIDTLKPYVRFRVQEAADLLDECAKRLGGCTPQLDCGADRKSVASQRCRDTGGQPFDSAPTTLTAAERDALDWACGGLECPDIEHDDNYDSDAAAILRNLLARLGG